MLKAIPGISKKILVVSIAALFLVSMVFFVSPGKVYGGSTLEVGAGKTYTTIQAAINAAATSGDTIVVAEGIYDEQIVINAKSLTLQGAGDTTIIRPSSPTILTSTYTYPPGIFGSGAVVSSIIMVKNTPTATIKDLKVDGINVASLPTTGSPDRLVGVLFGVSSGTIDNVTVTTIKTNGYANRTYDIELSGAASGVHSVEIKNSHITDWARNGIVVNGASLTANVHNNILVGPGTISGQVPNGILFISGAGGNATGNTIHGLHHDATSSRSAGILLYGTTGVTIENNTIYDTDDGIDLSSIATSAIVRGNNLYGNLETGVHIEDGSTLNAITGNTISNNGIAGIRFAGAGDPISAEADDPPGIGNYAHNNTITGNTKGIVNYDTTPQTFDATNNWWGATSGPLNATSNINGTGNAVSDNVNFDPWYLDAAMTTLSNYVAPTTTEAPATTTTEATTETTAPATTTTEAPTPASTPPRPLTSEEQASLNLSIAEQVDLYGASNIGFTKMLYDNILGRAAESEGLNSWVTDLNDGKITLGSVVYNFVFSKELEPIISSASPEEFITFLYKNVFNREQDSEGFNNWVTLMQNGMTKEEVLLCFIDSGEFKNICEMFGLKP